MANASSAALWPPNTPDCEVGNWCESIRAGRLPGKAPNLQRAEYSSHAHDRGRAAFFTAGS